jgi:hypothetical protein
MGKAVMTQCHPVNFGSDLPGRAVFFTNLGVRLDEEVSSLCAAKVSATPAFNETKSGKLA